MKKQVKLFAAWTWIAYVLGALLVTVLIYGAIGSLVSTTAADWLKVLPIGFPASYSAFRMRNNKKGSADSAVIQKDENIEPGDRRL